MSQKRKIIQLVVIVISFISISLLVKYNNQMLFNSDYYVNIYFNDIQFPTLNSLMLSVTKICDIPESILIFLVFGLFLLLKKKKSHLWLFTIATTLGTLLPLIIKSIIEKVRPVSNLLLETDYSFPSGHATIATVFLISSIVIIAPLINNGFLRKIFILCTSIIFPMVIISRVYLSVHWFSDVLAGVLLGSICYILASLRVQ